MKMTAIVQQLKKEHDRLTREIRGVSAALAAFGAAYAKPRRQLSAGGKARIAAAQRTRWAKVKSGQKQGATPKKRTMSVAARKRIAAAQRARWAKVKAERKRAA
jgi:hypothetical protein